MSFLEQYVFVMKPMAAALNILQSETNAYMGWLLPTIYILEEKLVNMESSAKVCLPLLHCLQHGLKKRKTRGQAF